MFDITSQPCLLLPIAIAWASVSDQSLVYLVISVDLMQHRPWHRPIESGIQVTAGLELQLPSFASARQH